jgi:YVTN family beta-propeller protein
VLSVSLSIILAAHYGRVNAEKTNQISQVPTTTAFNHPTNSSPIALSADNRLLWVVNPKDNSVSVIRTDQNTVITKIPVGVDPESVALDPADRFAFVANAGSNSVTIIKITNSDPDQFAATVDTSVGKDGQLTTGAEPWNIVTSPDGKRVFVANSGQDTITVIRVNEPKDDKKKDEDKVDDKVGGNSVPRRRPVDVQH